MDFNWIIEQVYSINIPTVVTSLLGSWGVKELFDWWKQRNLQSQQAAMHNSLQSQKAKIDEQLEIAKVQCQQDIHAHYLQTQLKMASIYKAYPEVHSPLKGAEGAVYQLFFHSFMTQNEAYKIWCGLTIKLAEHSLFLDDELKEACVEAKDILMEAIRSHSSMNQDSKTSLMEDIHKKIEKVTTLMRFQLLKDKINVHLNDTKTEDLVKNLVFSQES